MAFGGARFGQQLGNLRGAISPQAVAASGDVRFDDGKLIGAHSADRLFFEQYNDVLVSHEFTDVAQAVSLRMDSRKLTACATSPLKIRFSAYASTRFRRLRACAGERETPGSSL